MGDLGDLRDGDIWRGDPVSPLQSEDCGAMFVKHPAGHQTVGAQYSLAIYIVDCPEALHPSF
jgi:hypothetical protein